MSKVTCTCTCTSDNIIILYAHMYTTLLATLHMQARRSSEQSAATLLYNTVVNRIQRMIQFNARNN